MPSIGSLPEHLILKPIQPVPLPKNYHFAVSAGPGASPALQRRPAIVLLIGNMTAQPIGKQDEKGALGFNVLLASILGHAAQFNLWDQSIPCQALALGPDNTTYVARSNVQPLQLPTAPHAPLTHQYQLGCATPQPAPVPVGMAPPAGRRLYYRADPGGGPPSSLPKAWYVRPDDRLEDSASYRGFDRFTFWLAFYAVAPKLAANVALGEVLAQRLNAHKSDVVPMSASLATIGNAIVANMSPKVVPGLMWTAGRVVVVLAYSLPVVTVMEFDTAGLHKEPLSTWLAKESPGTVWNYRTMGGGPHPPIWGMNGLV
ncbi:hypothetical protein HLB44_32735 [Aquincola sp. S2]|uniref:Uncharacterized protein n=1 Tax=Pseudaquabacterium terrae TaxID=2732868 RepID=A0ABX2ESN4_9BURK|nr:hypothetical protein [Aquabacterium terrae]NRF71762.1 hypothetical protein [Aquabacterium terrae]